MEWLKDDSIGWAKLTVATQKLQLFRKGMVPKFGHPDKSDQNKSWQVRLHWQSTAGDRQLITQDKR